MKITDWTLKGSDGQTIYGNTHVPDSQSKGAVIICHGYKGYKDYGFFPRLAQRIAEDGWTAHRFNFSHSGMTNNIDTFEKPDLFEADKWSRQIFDLQAVAGAVQQGDIEGAEAQTGKPIIWVGHSRGGLTTLLTAARAFAKDADSLVKPSGVVAVCSPDEPCNLPKEDKKTFHINGRMPVKSSRTGQILYVGLPWLEEIENDPKAFDPVRASKKIKCPLLFLHGDNDDAVSVETSKKLYETAQKKGSKQAQLKIIANAGHTFNCPNPLPNGQEAPKETKQMIDALVEFCNTINS